MPLISNLRDVTVVTAVLLLGVLPVAAQTSPIEASATPTSIGFEDPDDTSNLLEYRLPDWGWRTWDLAFDLNGGGSDIYAGDDWRQVRNTFGTTLATDFKLYRESEARTWNVDGFLSGSYWRRHDGDQDSESSSRDLRGSLTIAGNWREYMGEGPFHLQATGRVNRRYDETSRETVDPAGTVETRWVARGSSYLGGLGAGVGRVRDVTPIVRAERLSERLVALGRAPLTSAQVREVAAVLATEQGYRTVFDRPERSFWRDVLEPLLDPDNPLSPYEIFYLRDVMSENVGTRLEGADLTVGASYEELRDDVGETEFLGIRRSASATLGWYHNLSLNQQVSAQGRVNYARQNVRENRGDYLYGSVSLKHLWTIADRYRWDNSLLLSSDYNDLEDADAEDIRRVYQARLASVFRIFVEDRMAVSFSFEGRNGQHYDDDVTNGDETEIYQRQWSWAYGVGLEYYLDTFLY